MRRLLAIVIVLLMILQVPPAIAQEPKGMVITSFANGQPNMELLISDELDNSDTAVILPANGKVDKATFKMEAHDYLIEENHIFNDTRTFTDAVPKGHNVVITDDMVVMQSYNESITVEDDMFINGTHTNLIYDENLDLHLDYQELAWTQNGFGGGPGESGPDNGPEISMFMNSTNIDWSSRAGEVRLMPNYTWDTWTPIGSVPEARGKMSVAIEDDGGTMYLFGGDEHNNDSFFADFYSLDIATGTFTQICSNCMPDEVSNGTMIWDIANNSVVLDGGYSELLGMVNQVSYVWNGNSWMVGPSLTNPVYSHSEIFINEDNTSVIFGGLNILENPVDSIIIREIGQVTDITSQITNVPPARYNHSAVWDPNSRTMIVFGGQDSSGNYLNDLRVLDYDNMKWVKPPITLGPSPRAAHTAVWDPEARGMIVYGGCNGIIAFDTAWIYWPSNETWMELAGSTGPQTDHAAVWSEPQQSMYTWGGYTNEWGDVDPTLNYVLKRSYQGTGEVYSTIFDAGDVVSWRHLEYLGQWGGETSVELHLRAGDTSSPDGSWSNWWGPYNEDNLDITSEGFPSTRYLQYRLTLQSNIPSETPIIDNITIYYSYFINQGSMVTESYDLGFKPAGWFTLTKDGYFPNWTLLTITVETSDDEINWITQKYTDDANLSTMETGRFLRFMVNMETSISADTPTLRAIVLNFHYFHERGFIHLEVPTDMKPIEWVQTSWIGSPQMGQEHVGRLEVFASLDNGNIWTQVSNDDKWYPKVQPDPLPNVIIFNVSFIGSTEGWTFLKELNVSFASQSLPEEIRIDVGDDNIYDWERIDILRPGEVIETPSFAMEFTKYLKDNQEKADPTGNIEVPIRIHSKNPCKIVLSALFIDVLVDNMLPMIKSIPPTEGFVGFEYMYEIVAEDPEEDNLTYDLRLAPLGMVMMQQDELPYLLWTPFNEDLGVHTIEIVVSDGLGVVRQNFDLNISDQKTNDVPFFVSTPPDMDIQTWVVIVNLGEEFMYRIAVQDNDPEDIGNLKVSLEVAYPVMEFDGMSFTLRWIPTDPKDVDEHEIVLKVTDGKGSSLQTFIIKVEIGPNNPPELDNKVPSIIKVQPGIEFIYQIEATDPDGDEITFRLEGAPPWLSVTPNGEVRGTPGTEDIGSYDITIVISDGKEEVEIQTTLVVEEPGSSNGIAFDDLLGFLLILVIIIVVVSLVVVAVRRKKKSKKVMKPEPEPSRPRKPAPAPVHRAPPVDRSPPPVHRAPAAVATVGATTPAATPPPKKADEEKPIIEEVYLMYNDGRLISHETRRLRPDMDQQIISGMLKAITDFVKDSFNREGTLGGLDYGDFRIMLEAGTHATLALVISGKETPALREELKRTLEKIQGLYAGIIEDWDGDSNHFKDVKKYLMPLILMGRTMEEEAEMGDVRVMSALEFYQGYVRVKVAIKNKYPFMIHDVTLKTIYDKKALSLSHIEPEYEMEGAEVMIGNISPKEKKTVAFYLDPLICMESNIDASVMYKNYKGEIKTSMMKRRPVDIVCPIFYTEQNVNVAMLKRLINELKYRDSKIYTIPKSLTPENTLTLAKETVQAHDVKFVREFSEDEPYIGEAWFYGKTKQSFEDLVIRVTVRAESNTLELFVSSSNLATIPGLLADLAHGLKRRYTTQRTTKEDLSQVTDIKVKSSLEKSRLLIEKYATTEIEADSDEMDL